jgi:hypothetical protein
MKNFSPSGKTTERAVKKCVMLGLPLCQYRGGG